MMHQKESKIETIKKAVHQWRTVSKINNKDGQQFRFHEKELLFYFFVIYILNIISLSITLCLASADLVLLEHTLLQ
jgi:hypothetical protein